MYSRDKWYLYTYTYAAMLSLLRTYAPRDFETAKYDDLIREIG